MDQNVFEPLDGVLNRVRDVDLDVKLRNKAEVQHIRLKHEKKIREFLKEKYHHENYKEIKKDVKKVEDMLAAAHALDIKLDDEMVGEVNRFTERLIQERNMRKSRDLMLQNAVGSCTRNDVEKIKNLVEGAKEQNVEAEYIQASEKLLGQMEGNIKARDTLQMLVDYPQREYPDPEELDPKNKKAKGAPPKKKKKSPPFPLPDWAEELSAVQAKVKEMQELAN